MMLLAAALALNLGLAQDTGLRLTSTGTGEDDVRWVLDGAELAWTDDRHAAFVELPAGDHALWAVAESAGAWRVVARADTPGDGQAHFVPAWTAVHPADPPGRLPLLPIAFVALALLPSWRWPSRRPSVAVEVSLKRCALPSALED